MSFMCSIIIGKQYIVKYYVGGKIGYHLVKMVL